MMMAATGPILSENEQREFQAGFWKLPASATWEEIDRAASADKDEHVIFYDYEDWRETMIRLYGPILPE